MQWSYFICGTINIIGSVSTTAGLVLGNIPTTKHLTFVTGSATVGSRAVRYYCKTYETFWVCSVATEHGLKEAIKFIIKK